VCDARQSLAPVENDIFAGIERTKMSGNIVIFHGDGDGGIALFLQGIAEFG